MIEKKKKIKNTTELRTSAEERLISKKTVLEKVSDVDIRKLIHELQVHQIELEIQNEELRRIHQELEESRNKYVDLFDFAPIGYLTFDENGKIIEANLTATDQLAIEREYLINKSFYRCINFEDRDIFYQHLQKVFKSKTSSMCEIRLKGRGKEFYAQLNIMMIQGSNDNCSCRTSIIDITKRKKAEEELIKYHEHLEELVEGRTAALQMANEELLKAIAERNLAEKAIRKSEEKYRTLYESCKDGIIYTDIEGNILDVNQAYLDMLSYSKNEMKNITHKQLTPQKWHEMEKNIIENQVLAKGYSDEYEKEYIRKNSTIFPISIKMWLIRNERGNPVGMWGIARDITKHKKAEEELKRLNEEQKYHLTQLESKNKDLEIFSHSVSGNLKAPLNLISRYSNILLENYAGNLSDKGKQLLNIIRKNTHTLD